MMNGLDHGRTASPGHMTEVLQSVKNGVNTFPGDVSSTPACRFAWADIHHIGPTAIVVENGHSPAY